MTDKTKSDLTESEVSEDMTDEEVVQIAQHRALSSLTVYEIVNLEGQEEIARPAKSLWWSAISAGFGISSSVLSEGILHHVFEDHPYRFAIENLGYTVGFILVILCRMQLFTENTITVVLPLLKRRNQEVFLCVARLWAIVFAGNMVGSLAAATLYEFGGVIPPHLLDGSYYVARHFAENTAMEAFRYGIPAGFLIAAVVWMLPSSEGFEFWVIMLFTYLIAMGDFTHVIAGSHEAFLLLLTGEITLAKTVLGLILPSLAGNVLGGTGLFALLAYGQVVAEMEQRDPASSAYAPRKRKAGR